MRSNAGFRELGQLRLNHRFVGFLVLLGRSRAPPALMSGTVRRKKITPPKQIQYHVFHWLPVLLAALATDAPCFMKTWKFGSFSRPPAWPARRLTG